MRRRRLSAPFAQNIHTTAVKRTKSPSHSHRRWGMRYGTYVLSFSGLEYEKYATERENSTIYKTKCQISEPSPTTFLPFFTSFKCIEQYTLVGVTKTSDVLQARFWNTCSHPFSTCEEPWNSMIWYAIDIRAWRQTQHVMSGQVYSNTFRNNQPIAISIKDTINTLIVSVFILERWGFNEQMRHNRLFSLTKRSSIPKSSLRILSLPCPTHLPNNNDRNHIKSP